jgi:cytochrome d ubiquinol oxidase subunit II
MMARFAARPWGIVFPLLAIGGLVCVWWFQQKGEDGRSLVASGAFLAGMLTSAAFTVYRALLPAVDPANSLTVFNSAAPLYGLIVGLVWWSIDMVLAAVYFVLIYGLFRGKVRPGDGDPAY